MKRCKLKVKENFMQKVKFVCLLLKYFSIGNGELLVNYAIIGGSVVLNAMWRNQLKTLYIFVKLLFQTFSKFLN
jgi:hypothetical protein